MVRVIASLSAMCLLGTILGCHHTAGICDCAPRTYGCNGCCGGNCSSPTQFGCCPDQAGQAIQVGQPVYVTPGKQPEAIKEMPKGEPKKEAPMELKKEDTSYEPAPSL
ncbi:MAG: hypothetical protein K2R98_17950 [Gemmataceae bacterium]|nr:hypothetical protein [Gemmataceae bacterium]